MESTNKFSLGLLVTTGHAARQISPADIEAALERHASGDWGDVCAADWASNNLAVLHGGRLFSIYKSSQQVRFLVITEADRFSTTVLLPEDY